MPRGQNAPVTRAWVQDGGSSPRRQSRAPQRRWRRPPRRETVDPSTLQPLVRFDVTADEIADALWTAFRQARAGDITAREGQDAVSDYWKVAEAAGLSRDVGDIIIRQGEAKIRGQQ